MRSAALPVPADQPPSDDVREGLARNAIAFPDGIPGFEACRRFVLLTSDPLAPLQRLESIEGPPAAFLGIDPRLLMAEYRCRLSDNDMRALGKGETGGGVVFGHERAGVNRRGCGQGGSRGQNGRRREYDRRGHQH